MIRYKGAVESLGSMIWYLRTLNIDKDILSMKNFNIYDPMKKGQGLMLDGQTLAHIEVSTNVSVSSFHILKAIQVLLNSEGTEDGSLLKLLSRCITPSGRFHCFRCLCSPSNDVRCRQTTVPYLVVYAVARNCRYQCSVCMPLL